MKKSLMTVVGTLVLFFAISTTTAFADIAGSTLTAVKKYSAGETNTLVYRCDAVTPDYEYMYTVVVNYLTGMNVLTGELATGEINGGTFSYNGAVGDAAIARWDGDENLGTGYGSLPNGDSAYFTNQVILNSSFTGNVVLTYYLFGDGYGDNPHGLTNTLTLQDANASNPPTATTVAAAPVTWDFAVLRGVSNPNEISSTGYFEYGIDTSYGFSSPTFDLGVGGEDVTKVFTSPELVPNTEYHYRFVAYNVIGTNYGADETVITPASPVITPAIRFQPLDINSRVAACQSATNHPFDARAADDFMLANSTTTVGAVRWWVGEWSGAPPYVSPSSFNIFIYTNYAGGAGCYPTNVIQTWNIPTAQCNEELFDVATDTYGYRARLEPPFTPESNMHYWIVIQPVLDYPPQAGLKLAATDVNLCTAMQVFALAGFPDWTVKDSDIAFILYPYSEAPPVMVTNNYGWENFGTILGKYGNLTNEMNIVSGYDSNWPGTVTPRSGNRMLQVTESPLGGTPQAFVSWVTNLVDGDEITASFYGWDSTTNTYPRMRIWGHYTTSDDINGYNGSAGGNDTYTDGTGEWNQVGYTWTFDSDSGARDALVIEARLYSETDGDNYWVDDLQTITPDSATVIFPIPEPGIFMVLVAGLLFLIKKR